MDEIIFEGPEGRQAYITALRRIAHPKGDILHALKRSDPGFAEFGEAYFSTIGHGETKGWKQHTQMQLNLVVPVGRIRFSIFSEEHARTKVVEIGEHNYCRLTVNPGLWVAFEGKGKGYSLLLNVASLEHDPDEAVNVDLSRFPLEAS